MRSNQKSLYASEVDNDGIYCIEAQVTLCKRASCFDIGNGLHDNDELDVDTDGIEIMILENTSVNFIN